MVLQIARRQIQFERQRHVSLLLSMSDEVAQVYHKSFIRSCRQFLLLLNYERNPCHETIHSISPVITDRKIINADFAIYFSKEKPSRTQFINSTLQCIFRHVKCQKVWILTKMENCSWKVRRGTIGIFIIHLKFLKYNTQNSKSHTPVKDQ